MRALVLVFTLAGCIGLDPTSGNEKDSTSGDTSGVVSAGPFTVSPGEIDFGTLAIGATADDELVIHNTSSGLVRLIADLEGDSAFSLTESSVAIAPDEETVLTLHFEVAEAIAYAASLTIADADNNNVVVPISGSGPVESDADTDTDADTDADTDTDVTGVGDIAVSPTSHDFSQVDTGNTATNTFTIRNNGGDDLLVSDVRFSDATFTMLSTTMSLPQIIHPGDSETATVQFAPTMVRSYAGTMTVTSDDPDGPVVVALTGEGADLCDICSGLIEVDTGSDPYSISSFVSLLGLPSTVTVRISNAGDMDLSVSDVYVNNDSISTCGTFTISGWRGAATLRPGSSTTFDVSYRATDICADLPLASLDQNVIHILSDDPSQGDYVIELSGIGIN